MRTHAKNTAFLLLALLGSSGLFADGSKFDREEFASSLLGSSQALTQPGTQLVFPQIANGVGAGLEVGTIIILVNAGTVDANVNLTLRKTDGSPFSLTIMDPFTDEAIGSGSEISLSISASQTILMETDSQGDLATGWLKVDASSPVAGLAAYSLGDAETGELFTIVGVEASPSSADFFLPVIKVDEGETNTSIAMCNISDQTAYLQGTLTDHEGGVFNQLISLGPGEHSARYVNEIFSGMESPFLGYLRLVRSDAAGTPTGEQDIHAVAVISVEGALTVMPVAQSLP
jgi:hypothetical protein